jgi:hypothetical protein
MFIWSTFLGDKKSTLCKIAVEMWPSTIAPFIEEVTVKNMLGG